MVYALERLTMVHVTFIHPDLGIGGAERAVIDVALALKSRNHTVNFVTAHHDRKHAFQETTDGSLDVVAVGDWLPRSILGRCYALCAYIRMLYAAIYLVYFSDFKPDVVFCDQISACIPILRRSKAKVIFYCHFPDMLLTHRKGFLKKIYRVPIDRLEEWTTGQAHCVLVNSKFTGASMKYGNNYAITISNLCVRVISILRYQLGLFNRCVVGSSSFTYNKKKI